MYIFFLAVLEKIQYQKNCTLPDVIVIIIIDCKHLFFNDRCRRRRQTSYIIGVDLQCAVPSNNSP